LHIAIAVDALDADLAEVDIDGAPVVDHARRRRHYGGGDVDFGALIGGLSGRANQFQRQQQGAARFYRHVHSGSRLKVR